MSKFVNYQKRSVTLPNGCKNLIDLLVPSPPSKIHGRRPGHEQPVVTRGKSGSIELSEIRKLVAMPFESRGPAFILMLSLPDERLTFDFTRIQGQPMHVSVIFEKDLDRDALMRAFLVAHDLQPPSHDRPSAPLVPGVPIQFIYHISPPPSDPLSAAKFTDEFFRDVCGLTDESLLIFRHWKVPTD